MVTKPRKVRTKRGTKWAIRWREQTERGEMRRQLSVATEQLAWDLYYSKIEEMTKKRHGLKYIKPILVSEALYLFRDTYLKTTSPAHQQREKSRIAILADYFPDKHAHEVVRADIESLRDRMLLAGAANKTINNYLSALSSFFEWCLVQKDPHTEINPVSAVKFLPKCPREIRDAYTEDELARIYSAACKCCRDGYVLLAEMGLRVGELFAAHKRHFNLKSNIFRLPHSEATRVKGKRDRTVALKSSVVDVIRRLPDGPVMRIPRDTFEDHWVATRKRAGVGGTLHEFRHTYVTEIANNPQVPVALGMANTGHSSYDVYRGYQHFTDEQIARVRYQENSRPKVAAKVDLPGTIEAGSVQNGLVETIKKQILAELQVGVVASPRGFEPQLIIQKIKENPDILTDLVNEHVQKLLGEFDLKKAGGKNA